MENFGKIMTVAIVMITAPLINGYVFIKLWYWFVSPTFNINELKLVEGIGIMLILSFLKTKKPAKEKQNAWQEFGENVFMVVINACFALFFGWIVTLFM